MDNMKQKNKTVGLKSNDKKIINLILDKIADDRLEDYFAKQAKLALDMTPAEFRDWLCKVKVR